MAAVANFSPVYDEFLNYLVEKATPNEILAFQVSDQAQERAIDLVERNNAGTLTSEEVVELEQMRQFDRLVSLLKSKALAALNPS